MPNSPTRRHGLRAPSPLGRRRARPRVRPRPARPRVRRPPGPRPPCPAAATSAPTSSSSTRRRPTSRASSTDLPAAGVGPVRHRPLPAALQAGHLQRAQRPARLLHLGLGPRPEPRRRQINGDVTVDAGWFNGNATQNFWRSAENLALNPVNGTDRWAVAQAAPFRRMHVEGGLNLAPERLRLGQRRLHRRQQDRRHRRPVLAAAVVHPRQLDRRLDQRRVEHGVLRCPGRARAELPEPAVHHAGHHPRLAREAVPVPRRQRATRCSCRTSAPTRAGSPGRHTAGHLDPADPVLRGQARRLPRRPSTRRSPRASTCCSPRHLPRGPADRRHPRRTPWCSASVTPRSSRTTGWTR